MVVNQLMLLGEEMALALALALGMVVNELMLLGEEIGRGWLRVYPLALGV